MGCAYWSVFREYTFIELILNKGNSPCGFQQKLDFMESIMVNPLFLECSG
jgi:hypothetical protein